MNEFARLPARDRADVFEETSARHGIGRAVIVEKDFWVCWTLAQLYGHSGPSDARSQEPALLFKGGTSLSKAYALIDRFSEDVDLTVDRGLLIADEDSPDVQGISRRERERRIEAVGGKCESYVRETIAPFLRGREIDWTTDDVEIDGDDSNTLLVAYPRALADSSYGGSAYTKPRIRLEFGARGELWPAERRDITSYAAEQFPSLFSAPSTTVWVMSPRRTLWEKATILHAIASSGRIGEGERLSRHYSDFARLASAALGDDAIADIELLLNVARHKATYFHSSKARYDLAKPGTLRLLPSKELTTQMEADYKRMREMFIADPPTFAEIIADIAKIEQRINNEGI